MNMRKYRAWVRNADYLVSEGNVFEVVIDDYGAEATLKPFGWWCPECDRVFDRDAIERNPHGSDKLRMDRVIA